MSDDSGLLGWVLGLWVGFGGVGGRGGKCDGSFSGGGCVWEVVAFWIMWVVAGA